MIWSSPPSLISWSPRLALSYQPYWQVCKSGHRVVDVDINLIVADVDIQLAPWVSQKGKLSTFYFPVKSCCIVIPPHSYSRWFYFDCKNFIWLENNSSLEGPAVLSAKISWRFSWELTLATTHHPPSIHCWHSQLTVQGLKLPRKVGLLVKLLSVNYKL